MALRENFPLAEDPPYLEGTSDGWEYRTEFSGTTLEQTYNMVLQFLEDEGYGDVPVPDGVEEILLFKLKTRNKQILMFEDNGYVHNPIKILFDKFTKNRPKLILCIYNEAIPHHLVRFHGVADDGR